MPKVNDVIKGLLNKGIKAEKVMSRKKMFANLLGKKDYQVLADKKGEKL
ncbi:hypothetical protein V1498_15755 [Peribacillus sp. SCS-26]